MAAESSKKRTRYACKCLNVQIRSSKPVGAVPPELAGEPGFTQVYVKADGISAAHPQLTLRIRSKATSMEGTHRCAQFMSLACLICRTLVYRVHQVISSKLAAQEGPVIPKAGWVEEDVLRASSGWIEVFEDVLTDAQVTRLESSPQFSSLFSLVLPPLVQDSLPTSPPLPLEPESPTKPALKYLDMEPLFPKVSTTTDPVFVRLSNIASAQSQRLRVQAEQEISDFVKGKIAQIAERERDLRLEVHTLMHVYKDGLRIAEEEGKPVSLRPRPWKEPSGLSATSAAVSVQDFVPAPITSPRVSPETPRVSTLSASLATSRFHHPQAPEKSSQPSSWSATSLLLNSEHRASTHGGSLLEIKRHLDDELDMATSHRYFIIEEEMARMKAAMEPRKEERQTHVVGPTPTPTASKDTPPTPTSLKAKRKVTFDLNTTTSDQENGLAAHDSEEMVFDIEEETGMDRPQESGVVLPLVEQQSTRSKQRPEVAGSLRSPSLISTKPGTSSSLTRPSPLRISASPEDFAAPSTTSTSLRASHSRGPSFELPASPQAVSSSLPEENGIAISARSRDEEVNLHDDEMMKALAAGTPSHRASWINGNKTRGEFLYRGKERIFDSAMLVGDEDSDDDSIKRWEVIPEDEEASSGSSRMQGIPGSMPVAIRSMGKKRQEPLSLASYRPSTIQNSGQSAR